MNQKLSDRLTFLVEYMDLPEATGDPEASWEPYQLAFLNSEATLTSDAKSRQVGWSFIAAADAVAHSILVPRSTSIFISINRIEAAEKVRYANYCIEALDADLRPELIIANRQEIELENGSRIISHPCRPVRGKARARVYPDEMAHYPKDEEIYAATVPVITRGGVIRIGSSPLGAAGKFYEVHTEAFQPYPGYVRSNIPWWVSEHLCKDTTAAAQVAPSLPTYERVKAFGKARLLHIFENMPLPDFQQEYECYWADESVAWIPWGEIKRNQVDAQADQLHHVSLEVREHDPVSVGIEAVDELDALIQAGMVQFPLYGGMDIGRMKNLSEITLVSQRNATEFPFCLGISLDRMEFDDQKEILFHVLQKLPVSRMLIDRSGLGMQLAENAERAFPLLAEGVNFTGPIKEELAVELKVRFQQSRAPIPLDRELSMQIHSIKKLVSPSKRAVFDTTSNTRHHADKFWALALAHFASTEEGEGLQTMENPMSAYRG